jgi:hypothetical protein
MTLQQIKEMYSNYVVLACDQDTEVHIFYKDGICIASYAWYDDGNDGGEYRPDFCGINMTKDEIIDCYMEDHCSIREVLL